MKKYEKLWAVILTIALIVTMAPISEQTAKADNNTIVTDKATYEVGDAINVTATSTDSNAWVAICKKGETMTSGGTPSIYWYYINGSETTGTTGESGDLKYDIHVTHNSGDTVNINNKDQAALNRVRAGMEELPAGDYTIVILGGSSWYDVLGTKDITITSKGGEVTTQTQPGVNSITTDKDTYVIGEDIKVTASVENNDTWVGLYKKSDNPDSGNGGVTSIYWYYPNGTASGGYTGNPGVTYSNGDTVVINSTETAIFNNRSIEPGEYKVLLLGGTSGYEVLKEKDIQINDVAADSRELKVDKTEYTVDENNICNESIKVTAKGVGEGNNGDWIGIFKADDEIGTDESIYWYSINGTSTGNNQSVTHNSGDTVIINSALGSIINATRLDVVSDGNLPKGEYKVCLFSFGSYTIVDSKTIYVGHDYKEISRTDSTCTTEGSIVYKCNLCNEEYTEVIPKKQHNYEGVVVDPTCVDDGYILYTCENCGDTYTTPDNPITPATGIHKFPDIAKITPATITKDGAITQVCMNCGIEEKLATINKIASVIIAGEKYTYTGKAIYPSVKIIDSKGKELNKDTDYIVSYAKGCTSVGQYTVTINFKGKYDGTVTKTFTIIEKLTTFTPPAKAKTPKVKAGKKKVSLTLKKVKGAKGYKIQYATNKKFKKVTTKNVTKFKVTIKKLKSKKIYYIRVKAYKLNGKKKVYSSKWSSVKSVKIK